MSAKQISRADNLPVSLDDARISARANGGELDSEIQLFVAGLVDEIEHEIGRAINWQTWRVTLPAFPDAIPLPKPPVEQVVIVKYLDVDGAEQTLPESEYELDDTIEPSVIRLAAGKSWPATKVSQKAVVAEVICGYGSGDESTPPGIKGYILGRVQEKFTNVTATGLERLLWPFKVFL